MKIKNLPLALFALAAWSLSSFAAADWDTGPCPGTGTAPCIETEINDNIYHFNGIGGHVDAWHGRPAAEGGGDFMFSGDGIGVACGLDFNCSLTWSGRVKKCQDTSGNWRIGFQVNSASMSNGTFCNSFAFSGFPWYSKAPSAIPHCPFEDHCDSLVLYDPNASAYIANLGSINMSVLGIVVADEEHLHGVVFTPGVGANFSFASDFYNCEEETDCSIDGALTVDNATSLDIR